MSEYWQLQEAKNRFSELVDKALERGPQIVTRHGREAVVVVSVDDYARLTRPRKKLVAFLRDSPMAQVELDLGGKRGKMGKLGF